jgi:hypothetical protein
MHFCQPLRLVGYHNEGLAEEAAVKTERESKRLTLERRPSAALTGHGAATATT